MYHDSKKHLWCDFRSRHSSFVVNTASTQQSASLANNIGSRTSSTVHTVYYIGHLDNRIRILIMKLLVES